MPIPVSLGASTLVYGYGLTVCGWLCACSFSGGTVVGDLAPHEAFPIGGTNSVRGYDEGAVGSGRSCVVASGEISIPLVCLSSCCWMICFLLHEPATDMFTCWNELSNLCVL
jgi:hemolysin activation/secretion protein